LPLFAIRHSLYTHAMPIDYAAVKSWPFPDVEHRYTARDTLLYALGLGCGSDPTDPDELQFVFEENLRALPTMAVVSRTVAEGGQCTSVRQCGTIAAASNQIRAVHSSYSCSRSARRGGSAPM
jgi:2-enoyl-CoA hydratase-like protein